MEGPSCCERKRDEDLDPGDSHGAPRWQETQQEAGSRPEQRKPQAAGCFGSVPTRGSGAGADKSHIPPIPPCSVTGRTNAGKR